MRHGNATAGSVSERQGGERWFANCDLGCIEWVGNVQSGAARTPESQNLAEVYVLMDFACSGKIQGSNHASRGACGKIAGHWLGKFESSTRSFRSGLSSG